MCLQIILDKIAHKGKQMQAGIPPIYPMIPIWIEERVKLFASGDQSVLQHHRVLDMYIVISGTVDQQEIAFKLCYMR